MITYTESATVSVNGLNPTAGPGMILLANPSLASNSTQADDYLAETYIINASTPATTLDLGKITAGKMLWIQSDGPVQVTLTQSAVDKDMLVNSFILINTDFEAIKLSNPSATAAINVAVLVTGNRDAVGVGPGIF